MPVLRQGTPDRRIQLLEQGERFEDVYLQGVRAREAETEEGVQEKPSVRTERSRVLHMRWVRPSLSGLPSLRPVREGVQRLLGAYEDRSWYDWRSIKVRDCLFELSQEDTCRDTEHRRLFAETWIWLPPQVVHFISGFSQAQWLGSLPSHRSKNEERR